jgi:hypothetical protein
VVGESAGIASRTARDVFLKGGANIPIGGSCERCIATGENMSSSSQAMKLRFSGGVPFSRYDSMATDTGSSTVSRKYYGFDENFWHKIVRASEGNDTLDSKDAERILTLLKGDGEHETETRIASLIMSRLKSYGDLLDEGFLRYLSENYNKLIPVTEETAPRESDTDEDKRNSEHLDLLNKVS